MFKKAFKTALPISLAVCLIFAALPAQAKVSAEEAARLNKDLTPFGAERAGNADGTIPAWDGGITGIPANVTFDPASNELQPDPYADDKVLFTITAQNLAQYADKISPADGGNFFFAIIPLVQAIANHSQAATVFDPFGQGGGTIKIGTKGEISAADQFAQI